MVLIVEEIHPDRQLPRFCAILRTHIRSGDHYAVTLPAPDGIFYRLLQSRHVHFPHRNDDNGRHYGKSYSGRAICELAHDRAVFKEELDESFATIARHKLLRNRLQRKITSKLHVRRGNCCWFSRDERNDTTAATSVYARAISKRLPLILVAVRVADRRVLFPFSFRRHAL